MLGVSFLLGITSHETAGMLEGGRQGGRTPPQFLVDQLTLSQPGGAHYPHPVLLAPPDFQTLQHA